MEVFWFTHATSEAWDLGSTTFFVYYCRSFFADLWGGFSHFSGYPDCIVEQLPQAWCTYLNDISSDQLWF